MRNKSLVPFFHELEDVQNFFNRWSREPSFPFEENSGISLYEDENNIYIEAALPGIDPENIEVNMEKGVIWIKGEQKRKEDEGVRYHLRSSSSYSYRIPLPSQIDEQATPEASCSDGMLTITFPKGKTETTKRIQVKKS